MAAVLRVSLDTSDVDATERDCAVRVDVEDDAAYIRGAAAGPPR